MKLCFWQYLHPVKNDKPELLQLGKRWMKYIAYAISFVCSKVLLSVDMLKKVLAFPETNIYAIRFSKFISIEIQIFRELTYGLGTLSFKFWKIFLCLLKYF